MIGKTFLAYVVYIKIPGLQIEFKDIKKCPLKANQKKGRNKALDFIYIRIGLESQNDYFYNSRDKTTSKLVHWAIFSMVEM